MKETTYPVLVYVHRSPAVRFSTSQTDNVQSDIQRQGTLFDYTRPQYDAIKAFSREYTDAVLVGDEMALGTFAREHFPHVTPPVIDADKAASEAWTQWTISTKVLF